MSKNSAGTPSSGQNVVGQVTEEGGIKTRLRRRFRVPETDTRLGSDGDSIRSILFQCISAKPINIRWNRTDSDSEPYGKS